MGSMASATLPWQDLGQERLQDARSTLHAREHLLVAHGLSAQQGGGFHDGDLATGLGEGERCLEPRGSSADDEDVGTHVELALLQRLVEGPRAEPLPSGSEPPCRWPGRCPR